MNWFLMLFIWLLFVAIYASRINTYSNEYIYNTEIKKVRLSFAIIAFCPIFLLAVFGDPLGDVPSYLSHFSRLPESVLEYGSYVDKETTGKGFIFLGILIKNIFGNNQTAYRVIIGLLQSIPVILILREYSENYLMSVFLFVATGFHIGWMMNGLRQFLAVVIIFAATPFLVKKKYIPLLLMIMLAMWVHTSAALMVPVVFIVQGKSWNRRTVLTLIACIIAMYLSSRYTNILDVFLKGTEYENTMTIYSRLGDDGVNPIRVLISSIPMLLAFIGYRIIVEEDNPVINILTNMSVINTGLYLIGMVTNGIMVGRLPAYTSIYNLLFIPYLINHIFTERTREILYYILIAFYIVYYYFDYGF